MHILHGLPGPTCALYGARQALLQAPLPLIGDVAIDAFLDTCWPIVSAREAFRAALIAQGIWALPDAAGLRAQAADALKTGVLRVAPVPVSGLAPLKTEPAKATLSGKPFVMPPRLNPRPIWICAVGRWTAARRGNTSAAATAAATHSARNWKSTAWPTLPTN